MLKIETTRLYIALDEVCKKLSMKLIRTWTYPGLKPSRLYPILTTGLSLDSIWYSFACESHDDDVYLRLQREGVTKSNPYHNQLNIIIQTSQRHCLISERGHN